jgi:hypothetical protein
MSTGVAKLVRTGSRSIPAFAEEPQSRSPEYKEISGTNFLHREHRIRGTARRWNHRRVPASTHAENRVHSKWISKTLWTRAAGVLVLT